MKHANSGKVTPRYILDTSAIIAYLAAEPGGNHVKEIQHAAALPFVVLTELCYVLARASDQITAEETVYNVLRWRLPLLVADERLSLSAGFLKSHYGLGLADSYVAAFALTHQATLVTKDSDFRALQPSLQLLYLNHA